MAHSWAVLGPVVLHLLSAALTAQFTSGCARGHITTAAPRARTLNEVFETLLKAFPVRSPMLSAVLSGKLLGNLQSMNSA